VTTKKPKKPAGKPAAKKAAAKPAPRRKRAAGKPAPARAKRERKPKAEPIPHEVAAVATGLGVPPDDVVEDMAAATFAGDAGSATVMVETSLDPSFGSPESADVEPFAPLATDDDRDRAVRNGVIFLAVLGVAAVLAVLIGCAVAG